MHAYKRPHWIGRVSWAYNPNSVLLLSRKGSAATSGPAAAASASTSPPGHRLSERKLTGSAAECQGVHHPAAPL